MLDKEELEELAHYYDNRSTHLEMDNGMWVVPEFDHPERKSLREQDWSANVRDEFKGLTTDVIRAKLAPRRSNLILAFCNVLRDFNMGGIIRASNAFACQSVIYSGFRKYDPRGAVGTVQYENVFHFPEHTDMENYINELRKQGYIFAVAESDVYQHSVMLNHFSWPDKTILMLGEEGNGVPESIINDADVVVTIPQFGSVRSLNVASTAHIMIYDYMAKRGKL